ncbi:hypothetical protein H920_04461 [Fukomys damarensis]|uniref:Uncharacterized protein n=1 Tax=Fukomys damarensis TaxID=885580 RepID=A0A091DV33_FUKDA|nr:hypothetical protein H920_04461 [Fukomys damarensis]
MGWRGRARYEEEASMRKGDGGGGVGPEYECACSKGAREVPGRGCQLKADKDYYFKKKIKFAADIEEDDDDDSDEHNDDDFDHDHEETEEKAPVKKLMLLNQLELPPSTKGLEAFQELRERSTLCRRFLAFVANIILKCYLK